MLGGLLKFRALWFSLLGVFLLVLPFLHTWPFFEDYISAFRTTNATMFAVWLLIVLSMNLLTGYSGQISLGHAAVVLVGAYAAAVLFDQYGVPLPLAIVLGALFTAVVGGVVIGIPAARLSGPYLAVATFSLIIMLPQVLKIDALARWTNGTLGIGIKEVGAPGFVSGFLDDKQWLYYVTMCTATFMTVLFWNLTRSRFGRAFVALRDSEIGAEQMGINVPLYKALAFGISSLYAGVAGGLYFMVQTRVTPDSLTFLNSILFLVAIVVGGLATILGSIFGALFLTFQGELISNLANIVPEADKMRGMIYGALLILTIIILPRGMAGFVRDIPGWRPAKLWGTVRSLRELPERLGLSSTVERRAKEQEDEGRKDGKSDHADRD